MRRSRASRPASAYYIRRNLLAKGCLSAQLARRRRYQQPRAVRRPAAFLDVMHRDFACRLWALLSALCSARLVWLSATVLAQAPAGIIRGRVDVRRTPPTIERRPNVNDLGMHTDHDAPDLGGRWSISNRRRRSPSPIRAAARDDGSAERDVRPARARDYGRARPWIFRTATTRITTSSRCARQRFDLGRYAAGRSKSVRFDRPGIVRVFCEIHSHMSAFILVFNHRYFAVTAADGRYQIGRVPPGRYTLVAWNEGAIRESRPSSSRRMAAPSKRISPCDRPRDDSRVAHKPDFSRQRRAGGRVDRRCGVFRQPHDDAGGRGRAAARADRSRHARRRAVRDAGAHADGHGAAGRGRSAVKGGGRYRRSPDRATSRPRIPGTAERRADGADRPERARACRGRANWISPTRASGAAAKFSRRSPDARPPASGRTPTACCR